MLHELSCEWVTYGMHHVWVTYVSHIGYNFEQEQYISQLPSSARHNLATSGIRKINIIFDQSEESKSVLFFAIHL